MLEYLIGGLLIAGIGWLYSKDKLPGQTPPAPATNPNAVVPPPSAGAPAIPGFPNGAAIPVPGNPNGVIIGPPVPGLPPVPPGTLPTLPPAGQIPPVIYPYLPQGLLENILPGDTSPIGVGDVIEVDLVTSGFPVPQNIPMVGHMYMEVVDMNAPGDTTPPKKLLAQFAVPELRLLGPQAVNRAAVIRKVVDV